MEAKIRQSSMLKENFNLVSHPLSLSLNHVRLSNKISRKLSKIQETSSDSSIGSLSIKFQCQQQKEKKKDSKSGEREGSMESKVFWRKKKLKYYLLSSKTRRQCKQNKKEMFRAMTEINPLSESIENKYLVERIKKVKKINMLISQTLQQLQEEENKVIEHALQ